MKVLKFGGSSVGSPERIREVQQIINKEKEPVLIIVSALQGITDQLEKLAVLAAAKDSSYLTILSEIKARHIYFTTQLFSTQLGSELMKKVEFYLIELENLISGVFLLNDLTPKIHDQILSYGELISSTILTALLEGSEWIDSRELIKTDNNFRNAHVNFDETNRLIVERFNKIKGKCFVAPGFIATTTDGITTTLGRGGSDYSAAIFAAALQASVLEIWTDVDGFMTADPKKVPKAFAIDRMSFAEAMELSHFGAKVIYTPTLQPVYLKNIEIVVKNTFNPDYPGTIITKEPNVLDNSLIKGVSSIDEIDLITLQGPGMVGVKGISSRLFGAIANCDVNIILITQASSEYSISFAISPLDTAKAIQSIENEFEQEINLRQAIKIVVEKDLSIIAIVGERMKNTPGISATLFSALGRNGISVIATAQGSSELNISVVIRRDSLHKGLNVIHEGFFLSHYKELHLFLVGTGTVGSSLLKQIRNQQQKLLDEHKLKINVTGISRSRKMVLDANGIDLLHYKEKVDLGEPANIDKYIQHIRELNLRNSVFIDCTADSNLASKYKDILNSYVSIVTANKVACSSEYALYKELKQTAQIRNVKFMFETNVGAGLPIISTINDLIRSGDRILRMEAVVSGTLNFIFNVLSEEIPMSQAVKMAKEKGYSEPDPRIDLSGVDVLRKLLILARESGYPIEKEDIELQTFLPDDCFQGTLDDFWLKVESYDKIFEEKRRKLTEKGLKWRFVASLNEGKGKVGLAEIDADHPAYRLEGSNNIILITTERYHEEPMVIRGYGAGAEVTAAGVFADIIRIANV